MSTARGGAGTIDSALAVPATFKLIEALILLYPL